MAKTLCRCVKFHGGYALCRRRAERQGPRAEFASSGHIAALGPRCLAHLKERTGSAPRRFCLVGLRHRLASSSTIAVIALAHLASGADGTATLERCRVGLQAIAVGTAKNQLPASELSASR